MSSPHREEGNVEEDKPKEHVHKDEQTEEGKGKGIEIEESPWKQLPTKPPVKHRMFIQDSNEEEGDKTKTGERVPTGEQMEIQTREGEGD